MGFADVIGAIDTQTSGAPPPNATPVSRGSFSSVIDSIDSGGNSAAPEKNGKVARNIGTAEAFGRGAAQGVTANFYDELRGLHEAGGATPDEPMSLGSVLRGAFHKMTGNKAAAQRYETATARVREENKQAEEQHPVASTVGNVAGAMALPVGGAAGGATLAARAGRGALIGAGYGALAGAGEGEDIGDRATRATTGALVGGAIGGAAPPIVEGVLQGGRAISAPVVSALRGAVNPENEAARRVVSAVQRDIQADPAARNRLTPQEFMAQRQQGGPAAIIDVGGETTKALARSAANTSPEARSILNDTINDRFEGQSARVTDWLRQTFHYPDAASQSAALDQAARGTNRVNYQRALREGDRQIMTPEMERLMTSPTVVEAMRRASTSGKDRAVTQGLGGFNAGVTVENGVVNFRRGPNGVPTYPNLQFWDATKKELDDMASSAARSGERDRAGVVGDLARSLRGELDTAVPSYAQARAGAAHFFGAQDALEAGQNFVTSKMENGQARAALARMSPTERQLFQDGFVSHFVNRLNETGDRRSVLNKIGESPAARERLQIALGPQRANELEAGLRAEGIMDTARRALQGNSTTARQLVELGLAGGSAGFGGVGIYNMDPHQMTYAAIAGALVAGRHHIDRRLAQRVAEMLTSNDPQILQRGVRVVARDHRLMEGLRSIDRRLASAGGENAPNGFIAAGMASHADENEPGGQRVRQ
jgi:hypothetical protein